MHGRRRTFLLERAGRSSRAAPRYCRRVRSKPEGLDDETVAAAIRDGWALEVGTMRYAPVGAGSYHWHVTDTAGGRRFVTVDDLGTKSWLGDTRDDAYRGLQDAFATAAALRDDGVALAVGPIRTVDGEALRRLGDRWSIALFPFVDGESADFGRYEDDDERLAVASALAALHAAAPPRCARTAGLDLPGGHHLENALRELGSTWTGGPLSEPARIAVKEAAPELVQLLALADRLAADAAGGELVVTHGEPHRANVLRTPEGPRLVDWDTVALAPPERDLWMIAERADDDAAALYTETSGRRVDPVALDYFRLTWDLKDIAEWLNVLRGPHLDNEDTRRQLEGLAQCGSIIDGWNAA